MEEVFTDEIAKRVYITYMFEPDKFLNDYYRENFGVIDLLIIFTIMADFCKNTYYPKKYRDILIDKLNVLRDIKDYLAKERREVINEMIANLNSTTDVKNCDTYINEIKGRSIAKVTDNMELTIAQYLNDINDDICIFNTHGKKNYFVNHPKQTEALCNSIGYLKVIRHLITENEWLKTNEVFINNFNEVIKHTTDKKIKKYIKKEVKIK